MRNSNPFTKRQIDFIKALNNKIMAIDDPDPEKNRAAAPMLVSRPESYRRPRIVARPGRNYRTISTLAVTMSLPARARTKYTPLAL